MKFHNDINELFKEVNVRIDDDGIFLPKIFCLVNLLNFYDQSELKDGEFDAISDFLWELELAFHVCDGDDR